MSQWLTSCWISKLDDFSLRGGTIQEWSLSWLLLNTLVEILTEALRQDKEMNGFSKLEK